MLLLEADTEQAEGIGNSAEKKRKGEVSGVFHTVDSFEFFDITHFGKLELCDSPIIFNPLDHGNAHLKKCECPKNSACTRIDPPFRSSKTQAAISAMKILSHSICIGSPLVLAIMAMPIQVATGQVAITSSPGFDVSWDGNDGEFFDPTPPPTGALAPDNLALATNGSSAFASSESQFFPTHQIAKLNDGFYGNSNSHINGPGTSPAFHGIALPQPTALTAIAWGRDNGNGAFDDSVPGTDHCGGQCDDRSIGEYTLQFNPTTRTATITFSSVPGQYYSLDASGDMTSWVKIDVGFRSQGMETTVRNTTTQRRTSKQFFRIREF